MNITKTTVETKVVTKGVRIDFTQEELTLLKHFIRCRDNPNNCAIERGGYTACTAFVDRFLAQLEDAKIW